MRHWRLGLILVAACAVQLGFLVAARPFGVVPNLLLTLVVMVGLAGTATTTLAVAVICGLLMDLQSGSDFGLRTSLFVLVALVTGLTQRAGFDRGLLVAFALVAVATILQTVVVLAGLVGHTTGWSWQVILGRIVLELVLNLGMAGLLWPLVRWVMEQEPVLPVTE